MFYLCRGCMYVCNHSSMYHRYLYVSETIFQSVPGLYSNNCFPFVMFHKSACTKEPLDLLQTQLLQELSFLKVREGWAALNFKEFSTRLECFSLFLRSSPSEPTQTSMTDPTATYYIHFPVIIAWYAYFLQTSKLNKHTMRRIRRNALSIAKLLPVTIDSKSASTLEQGEGLTISLSSNFTIFSSYFV